MTIESVAHYATFVGGNVAFLLILCAAVLLHRHARSNSTLAFLSGVIVLFAGTIIQIYAPYPDITYLKENGDIVGATGTFSDVWYFGSVVFYLGLLIASTGLLVYAIGMRARPVDPVS